MNNIYEKYNKHGVGFLGVYPEGTDKKEMNDFEIQYKPSFICKADSNKYLFHLLNPEVTPEVFVQNEMGDVLYSGAIDNWMYDTGKKRSAITEHYLEDAIEAYVNGKEIKVKSTQAYGCIIE